MAWPGRKKDEEEQEPVLTKEQLAAAGLDPDEIKTALSKGVTKEELVTFGDGMRTDFRAMLEELGTKFGRPATPTTEPTEEPSFMDDPERAVDNKVKAAVAPLQAQAAQMTFDGNLRELKRSIPEEEWQKYGPEFMESIKNVHLMFKQGYEFLQNTWNMILGRHVQEVSELRAASKNRKPFFVEGGGGGENQTTGNAGDKKTGVDALTEDDKKQADAWGVSYEHFAKSKSGLKFVGV